MALFRTGMGLFRTRVGLSSRIELRKIDCHLYECRERVSERMQERDNLVTTNQLKENIGESPRSHLCIQVMKSPYQSLSQSTHLSLNARRLPVGIWCPPPVTMFPMTSHGRDLVQHNTPLDRIEFGATGFRNCTTAPPPLACASARTQPATGLDWRRDCRGVGPLRRTAR